jgi:hypothetical protein
MTAITQPSVVGAAAAAPAATPPPPATPRRHPRRRRRLDPGRRACIPRFGRAFAILSKTGVTNVCASAIVERRGQPITGASILLACQDVGNDLQRRTAGLIPLRGD